MSEEKTELLEILKHAINIEIYGQEYYYGFCEVLKDSNAAAIMRGLAKDEQGHQIALEREYLNIAGKKFSAVDQGFMTANSRNEVQSIFQKEDFNIEDAKQALKLGIMTEERSISFYSEKAKSTEHPGLIKLFNKLTDFEKGHRKMLEDSLYYLEQEGTWYGYEPMTIEG